MLKQNSLNSISWRPKTSGWLLQVKAKERNKEKKKNSKKGKNDMNKVEMLYSTSAEIISVFCVPYFHSLPSPLPKSRRIRNKARGHDTVSARAAATIIHGPTVRAVSNKNRWIADLQTKKKTVCLLPGTAHCKVHIVEELESRNINPQLLPVIMCTVQVMSKIPALDDLLFFEEPLEAQW